MVKSIINLVVQIIVVVAAVLVFAYFDPFGILSPKKKTLEDTPVTVTSIREIGQLITAEYYGEVLSSLQDELIEEVKKNDAVALTEFEKLNLQYMRALREFYERKDDIRVRWHSRRKDLMEYFYNANPDITNNVFYQDMIALVLKNFTPNYNDEGDLLLDIWKSEKTPREIDADFVLKGEVKGSLFTKKKNAELDEMTSTRSFKKRQIIVLGRGWVRAGIDFGTFTDRNFKYDREHRTVYLLGVMPSILDCDINPWFIPEQKVKGFEIIAATNRANDPDYLLKVKTSCLNKLRAQAETNGIVAQAKINAQESLKNFLSLLLNEPVDEVRIMGDPAESFDELFPKNKVISKERLSLLDSLLESIAKFSYDSAFKKVETLSKLKWDTSLKVLPVNRYSYFSQRIAEDELLSPEEWNTLNQEFSKEKFSKLDSIWFFSAETYRKNSNAAKGRVPKELQYDSDAGFWLDSTLMRKDYLKWDSAFMAVRRTDALASMRAKRKDAKARSIEFLKSQIRTIKFNNNASLNDPLQIQNRLDSLKSN